LSLRKLLYCVETVAALSNNLYVAVGGQKLLEDRTRKLLIIDNHRSNHAHALTQCHLLSHTRALMPVEWASGLPCCHSCRHLFPFRIKTAHESRFENRLCGPEARSTMQVRRI
ncbi:MAG: hypothetical protein WAM39_13960, partial [Bryobacteraceae bacterium]